MTYSSDVYGQGPEGTYGNTWAMPSTTISQTPFKEKKPTPPTKPNIEKPVSPTEKTTEVHYHYNQTENHYYDSRIIFSIIFWLSLSANSLTMCTYVCCVVIVLAWPNRLATLGIDTPSYNKSDA